MVDVRFNFATRHLDGLIRRHLLAEQVGLYPPPVLLLRRCTHFCYRCLRGYWAVGPLERCLESLCWRKWQMWVQNQVQVTATASVIILTARTVEKNHHDEAYPK
ncbi:hypothetical protein I7I48_03733 [Histoplasma ohiense]|nr:hypothetical protein I7I48_03733 [Histoplasma ohiense (nom. inval.)]